MKRPVLITAVAVGLVLLAALSLLGRTIGAGVKVRFPSSYSGEAEGLLAVRSLLGELRIPATVSAGSWRGLPEAEPRGLLVLATPLQRGVDEEEIAHLESWLRGGGSLLVIDDATVLERSPALDLFLDRIGLGGSWPVSEIDPRTLQPARPALAAASGTEVAPAGRDIRRVMLQSHGDIKLEGEAIPLVLADDGRVLAAETWFDHGLIVLVRGPLLANDRLLVADTLDLALRLLEELRRGGPVMFDEYHHGYGGAMAGTEGFHGTAVLLAVLQGFLALIIYSTARGIRFGPMRPPHERGRRSNLEFVRSMASLYRKADARRHILESLLHRFGREARTRWSLDENLSPAELSSTLAHYSGIDGRRIEEDLVSAREALDRERLSEREMLRWARRLAHLEQEVLGGDGKSA